MADKTGGSAIRLRDEDSARQIQRDAGTLFNTCLQAFHAFNELGDLAENMRILSLNAELAAGRAGRQGETVRVLTQYTRELVTRLATIERQMLDLKARTYAYSATTLRILHQLKAMDLALSAMRRRDSGEASARDARKAVRNARQTRLASILDNVAGMVESATRLTELAEAVADVISQANSIGTNIAIEAANAGRHEAEFEHVAETMRTFVRDLRDMTEAAAKSVGEATAAGQALQEKARHHLANSETGIQDREEAA